MSRARAESSAWPWILLGTATAGAGVLVAWAVSGRPSASPQRLEVSRTSLFTEDDIEAAARMLASENPRGSEQLHVEQVYTQLRAARRSHQSLYQRITAGAGWGQQGSQRRPVASHQSATPAFRALVREILDGKRASRLDRATKFFEPAQQDAAFAIAERARKKRAAKEPLTPQEARLLGYKRNAQEVRKDWLRHSQFIGSLDGVEFYS